MLKSNDYHEMYKAELEARTGCYCSFGRGFQIFYADPEHKKTVMQFNLEHIRENYALGTWFLEFEITAVNMARKGMMFKVAGE